MCCTQPCSFLNHAATVIFFLHSDMLAAGYFWLQNKAIFTHLDINSCTEMLELMVSLTNIKTRSALTACTNKVTYFPDGFPKVLTAPLDANMNHRVGILLILTIR